MEVRVTKMFYDKERMKDIYMVSVYSNNEIQNICLTKDEYNVLVSSLRNLQNDL
jgi:hypothetical protein